MRIQYILIIILFLLSCATKSTVAKNWFPDDVENFGPITEYITKFNTDDINVARNSYLAILIFIEEVIAAGHENLRRAYNLDSPTAKRPVLINGILTIIEDTDMTFPTAIWDELRMERMEVASFCVLWEFLLIIEHSRLYNDLLDHWYSLTGELLGEHKNIIAIHDELLIEIEPLLYPRYFEVF